MRGSSTQSDHTSRYDDQQEGAPAALVASIPLPAEVNSFIGREALLSEATHLLGTARLITLIGTGGVGKTRLLERLAADLTAIGKFKHGVVIVRLTDLKEADDRLESTIAVALGIMDNSSVPGLARLIEYFRHRQVLLMLDNCEHLVGDAPGTGQVPQLLTTLLKAAPGLQVVTTSRVRLSVQGEHLLLVPPLCSGDMASCDSVADASGEHEAVRLLIDRAAEVGVEIGEQDRPLAARLCRMLSGIPLAIELAAVQLDTMTLREMVDHPALLRLLVDGPSEQRHHRTMRAAMNWSYMLLTEAEQCMWGITSVFEGSFDQGSFDLEAAQAVCRGSGVDEHQVLGLLRRLVRKSVLIAEAEYGRTRYRMLEPIRQYGIELVAEAGREDALRRAHAEYFEALAERCTREWFGPGEIEWMLRMRADMPNLRAAQEHFLASTDAEGRALDLAINACRTRFAYFAGVLNESRRMLKLGLDELPEDPSVPRVAALSLASWVARCQGNQELATPLLDEADTAARLLDLQDSFAPLLFSRGSRMFLSEPEVAKARQALVLLDAAAREFRAQGAAGDAWMAQLFHAMAQAFFGDRDSAFAETRQLLATARLAGAQWSISWALWATALAELQFGDPEQARVLAQEGLRIQREIGDKWGPTWGIWLIANVAVALEEHELGAQLFGGARMGQRLTQASVLGLLPMLRRQQQSEAQARRELGDDEFEIQLAMGDSQSWEEVLDLGLALQSKRSRDSAEELPGGLSEREFEVAGLVAKGMTNREVAQRLRISFRTVEVHVQNINRKLGVTNRVEITAWYLALPAAS
jgi:predicted ATPase/DNA-binding CsgD family transcriptional regulator